MKNIFKKLFIPSGEKTTVIAYNSWIVRWHSVVYSHSKYSNYATELDQSEIFPSEIDAKKFAEALMNASDLLRNDSFKVTVEANQSKLTEQPA